MPFSNTDSSIHPRPNSRIRDPKPYRRLTQHRIPDLPKNQTAPMNRKTDSAAVAYRMTSKKYLVRTVDVFYYC